MLFRCKHSLVLEILKHKIWRRFALVSHPHSKFCGTRPLVPRDLCPWIWPLKRVTLQACCVADANTRDVIFLIFKGEALGYFHHPLNKLLHEKAGIMEIIWFTEVDRKNYFVLGVAWCEYRLWKYATHGSPNLRLYIMSWIWNERTKCDFIFSSQDVSIVWFYLMSAPRLVSPNLYKIHVDEIVNAFDISRSHIFSAGVWVNRMMLRWPRRAESVM